MLNFMCDVVFCCVLLCFVVVLCFVMFFVCKSVVHIPSLLGKKSCKEKEKSYNVFIGYEGS